MNAALLELATSTPGFTEPPELNELHDLLLKVKGVPGDLLEIGVYCGRSLVIMAAAAEFFGCVAYGVDPFPANPSEVDRLYPHGIEAEAREGITRARALKVNPYDATCDVLHRGGLVAYLTRGTSADWERNQPTTQLRAAFIDGDHAYPAVLADMEIASARLTPGGLLILDDSDFPGVARAIGEWVNNHGWEIVHRGRLLALKRGAA